MTRKRNDALTANTRDKSPPEKHTCPRCKHHKMWSPRGSMTPKYRRKCTKCGYEEKI